MKKLNIYYYLKKIGGEKSLAGDQVVVELEDEYNQIVQDNK
jgi:hypothetical protein